MQLTQTECGLIAAQMVLRTYGSREPLVRLRQDFEAGRDGLSLKQVRDLLRSRGMESGMFRASVPALASLDLPVVLYWENHHYVVLERLDHRGAVIVDPAGGRRRITHAELEHSFSQRVITATPGPDFAPVQEREPNPWVSYLRPAAQAWPHLLAVACLSVLVFGAGLVAPTLTRWLVDQQVSGSAPSWSVVAVLGVAGFGLSLMILSVGRAFLVTALTVHVGRRTMGRVFGHLLDLPYRYFAARSPGELLFRLNSVNAVRDLVSTQLAQGALDLGMSLVLLGYMLYLSPTLMAVACCFYVLLVAILVLTRRRVGELLDTEMTHTSKSQSLQLESVVAAAALRMSGGERRFFEDWGEVYEKALRANRRRTNVQGVITSGVTSLQVIAPVAVFMVGLQQAQDGQVSLGTVVAFQTVAAMFFGLATSVFGCWSQMVQGRSYLNRLSDIVDEERPPRPGTCRADLDGHLEARDVSFRYSRHSADVLEGIDLAVRPGECVAVVGASGSGKSTLGKVLCGLFEPTGGRVAYDGRVIADYDRRHFYDQVGYVPQEVHLLNRTLEENITMGKSGLDEDDARRAAAAAQIHGEIEPLPMGYQTLVAEMGANFSGGQRQRIALARALVKGPRVLILDEATSSLDSQNEARISRTLREQSCTLLIIAHRMSTVVDADRIHVMEHGRIVQTGTHAELAHIDGPYRRLFAASLGDTAATPAG